MTKEQLEAIKARWELCEPQNEDIPLLIEEIERLRSTLEWYAEGNGGEEDDADYIQHPSRIHWYNHFGRKAREALSGGGNG